MLPWRVFEDFNDLLYFDDKRGGVPHLDWCYSGFRAADSDCGLIDIPIAGHQFTLEHGQGTNAFVKEILDIALVTTNWSTLFPNSRLHNLIAPTFDQLPLLLSWTIRSHGR